jgi:hypothetical protein
LKYPVAVSPMSLFVKNLAKVWSYSSDFDSQGNGIPGDKSPYVVPKKSQLLDLPPDYFISFCFFPLYIIFCLLFLIEIKPFLCLRIQYIPVTLGVFSIITPVYYIISTPPVLVTAYNPVNFLEQCHL